MRNKNRWTRTEMLLGAILFMAASCATIQATAFWRVHQAVSRLQQRMDGLNNLEEYEPPKYEFGN